MSIKIYAFDNFTGQINIPKKIGTFPVEVTTAATVSQLKEIIDAAQLFFVYTKLPAKYDFVVKTEEEKRILQNALNYTKHKYNVACETESIWYFDRKVDHTVIIGDNVDIHGTDLGVLLSIFLSGIRDAESYAKKKREVYIVINKRSSVELLRTPLFDEAVNLCNKNPCCVVLNRAEEVVYRSNYGKVAVPYNSKTHTARYKAEHFKNNDGIFKIEQK